MLGTPRYAAALLQHERYCEALEQCGLEVIPLDADARFPDSTFVEDTAVLTDKVAVLARPGAPSRQGEVAAVRDTLADCYEECVTMREPATLDGGDVCQAANQFFIGLSKRTNEAGTRELSAVLEKHDYDVTIVDIRKIAGLLHLKSGLSWVGDGQLVTSAALARHDAFHGYETIVVEAKEEYAANCVRVNDAVLVADGFPVLADTLSRAGHSVITLAMSEFRKMDGGLSCLSLRF